MEDDHKQEIPAKCSFCNRSQTMVRKLIAGPGGIYICDSCIDLAHSIINSEKNESEKKEEDK